MQFEQVFVLLPTASGHQDITDDNDKTLGHEEAQVYVNLDSDGEDEQVRPEKPEETKITSEPQQQALQQQDVTPVPKDDKQKAFEPKGVENYLLYYFNQQFHELFKFLHFTNCSLG